MEPKLLPEGAAVSLVRASHPTPTGAHLKPPAFPSAELLPPPGPPLLFASFTSTVCPSIVCGVSCNAASPPSRDSKVTKPCDVAPHAAMKILQASDFTHTLGLSKPLGNVLSQHALLAPNFGKLWPKLSRVQTEAPKFGQNWTKVC